MTDKTEDKDENSLAWLGIRTNANAGAAFEYVCTLEDRQLSGGLVPGAIDRRKKDKRCGLNACGDQSSPSFN